MATTIISQQLQQITETLAGFSTLAPSPVVDQTFASLVSIVTSTPDSIADTLLRTSHVQSLLRQLQSFSARGETALEAYWVEQFLAQPSLTYFDLTQFPYFDNYEALAQLEITALRTHSSVTEPLLFVGGGPLPLSAIIFAKRYGVTVHVIDNNPAAVEAATALIERLSLSSQIVVTLADIRAYLPTERTIFLAAMVGQTAVEKQAVYAHLSSAVSDDTTILSRSVAGLGECLYPRKPDTPAFTDIAEYRGNREIINTVVISKKI